MKDTSTPQVRERVWVTKIDKTTDPPTVLEEIFVENGRLIDITRPQEPAHEHKPDVGD